MRRRAHPPHADPRLQDHSAWTALNRSGPTLIVLAEHKSPVIQKRGSRDHDHQRRSPPTASIRDSSLDTCCDSILARSSRIPRAGRRDHADLRGFIAETNATHLFMWSGVVHTPTLAPCPEGITRSTVLDICGIRTPFEVGDLSLAGSIVRRASARSRGRTCGRHYRGRPRDGDGRLGPMTLRLSGLASATRRGDASVRLSLPLTSCAQSLHFRHSPPPLCGAGASGDAPAAPSNPCGTLAFAARRRATLCVRTSA